MFNRFVSARRFRNAFAARPAASRPQRLNVESLEQRLVPTAQPLAQMYLVAADTPQAVTILDPETGREANVALGQPVADGDAQQRVPLLDPETQTPVADFYPLDPAAWASVFVGGATTSGDAPADGSPTEKTRKGVAGVVVVLPTADELLQGADGTGDAPQGTDGDAAAGVPTHDEIIEAIRERKELTPPDNGVTRLPYIEGQHEQGSTTLEYRPTLNDLLQPPSVNCDSIKIVDDEVKFERYYRAGFAFATGGEYYIGKLVVIEGVQYVQHGKYLVSLDVVRDAIEKTFSVGYGGEWREDPNAITRWFQANDVAGEVTKPHDERKVADRMFGPTANVGQQLAVLTLAMMTAVAENGLQQLLQTYGPAKAFVFLKWASHQGFRVVRDGYGRVRYIIDRAGKRIEKVDYAAMAKRFEEVNCFPPDTLVHTESGPRPIGQIEPGDRVWAYDFTAGVWRLRAVTWRHDAEYDAQLIDLTVRGETVTATENHPFWVVRGEALAERPRPQRLDPAENEGGALSGRWVNSQDVRAGDVVFLRDVGATAVEAVADRPGPSRVCNLTVAELPSFAVGVGGVLVHNTPASDLAIKRAEAELKLVQATSETEKTIADQELKAVKNEISAALRKADLPGAIAASGMTHEQAKLFFGWQSSTVTKGIGDFTKDQLLANGWTRERLIRAAEAYEMVALTTPANPSAAGRALQLRGLATLFD